MTIAASRSASTAMFVFALLAFFRPRRSQLDIVLTFEPNFLLTLFFLNPTGISRLSLGYIAANTSFYLIGAALVFLGITSFGLNPQDPYAFLATVGLLGLSALPLVVILVDETDNAFADVYSVAVSVQNLAPRRRQLGQSRLLREQKNNRGSEKDLFAHAAVRYHGSVS